jgi:DNA invertase Pin-like site-specific DNA recombinase
MNTTGALIPYFRKSSGEDPTESLRRQRAAVSAWAESNGVPLLDAVEEPGVSGSRHWRERRLGDVVEAIARGEAAGLIVEEQSRLTRGKQLHVAELWDELERLDARLVCTAEGIDTATGDHELNFGLRALLARDQWKQYKRRSDAVKAARIARGVMIGPAPTGYRKADDGTLDPDELAPVVRSLFEMRASGSSWGALLSYIAAETGREWTQAGIAGIVRNPVYRGDLVYGDLVNEGAHEALVDAPLWVAAQRRGKEQARSGRKTDKWLLSGLVTCGSCGHSLIVWRGASTRNGRPVKRFDRRYRCTNRACPERRSVNAPDIEAWLPETLWTLAGSKIKETLLGVDLAPLVEAVAMVQRRVDQVMAPEARDALGDLWAADVKARRLELEAAQAALGEAQATSGDDGADVHDLRERWPDMTTKERRDWLDWYGVRVEVRGSKPADWVLVLP